MAPTSAEAGSLKTGRKKEMPFMLQFQQNFIGPGWVQCLSVNQSASLGNVIAVCLSFRSQAPPWEQGQRATGQRRTDSPEEGVFMLSKVTNVCSVHPPITRNAVPHREWCCRNQGCGHLGTAGTEVIKMSYSACKSLRKHLPQRPCTKRSSCQKCPLLSGLCRQRVV